MSAAGAVMTASPARAASFGNQPGRRKAQPMVRVQVVGPIPMCRIHNSQGADDMNDHYEWISYSHWGMFPTATKSSR